MNIENLINALGISIECIDDNYEMEPARLWGDPVFLGLGSQLVISKEHAIVRYTKNMEGCIYPTSCFALHEACHGIFANTDETIIFAYESLVARELTGNDRYSWMSAFECCTITGGGCDGWQILSGNMHIHDIKEWHKAFDWLELNGYTINGKPVYGLGQSEDINIFKRRSMLSKADTARIDNDILRKWGIEYRI